MAIIKRWEIEESVRELSEEALKALEPDKPRPNAEALEGAAQSIEALIHETATSLIRNDHYKAGLALRFVWTCLTVENAHMQWDYIQAALEVENLKDRIKLLEETIAELTGAEASK